MAAATERVAAAAARRMGKLTGAGFAGLNQGGSAALSAGSGAAGIALKTGIGAAPAGGAAAMGMRVNFRWKWPENPNLRVTQALYRTTEAPRKDEVTAEIQQTLLGDLGVLCVSVLGKC